MNQSTEVNSSAASAAASTHRERPVITPRRPGLEFDEVPRHWLGGSVFGTHLINSINMVFPDGERFFVRSVRAYLKSVTDEQLREDVQRFVQQEARHGVEHEHFFAALERQGYRMRPLLDAYKFVAYKVIERASSPVLRLSTTAALEHFTASLAKFALTQPLLDEAHPTMRDLLKWHAAEEIEHRAVAFDVLQIVDPRLRTRIAGMAMATAVLSSFWLLFQCSLMWQDREQISLARLKAESDRAPVLTKVGVDVLGRAVLEYFQRDFHPLNDDTTPLAQAYFAEHPVAAG